MSFAKAQDLLRLAQMAACRRGGVSLEDICTEFGVSHRTAQRMTEALDTAFANVTTTDDGDRRRFWRMETPPPERLQARQETTVEALEIAARAAREQARLRHAHALEDLRDGLLARLSPRMQRGPKPMPRRCWQLWARSCAPVRPSPCAQR